MPFDYQLSRFDRKLRDALFDWLGEYKENWETDERAAEEVMLTLGDWAEEWRKDEEDYRRRQA